MNKRLKHVLIASGLLAALFSARLWLPNVQASSGQTPLYEGDKNPFDGMSPLLLWDEGWLTGSTNIRVLSVPQVVAWTPGKASSWAVETGMALDGVLDAENQRLYIVSQIYTGDEDLLDVKIPQDGLYPPTALWPMALITIDTESGQELERMVLEGEWVNTPNSGTATPIGVVGDILYMRNYGASRNLFAFNLKSGEISEDVLNLCEGSYPVKTIFAADMNGVLSLCIDYSSGTQTSLTFTALDGSGQQTLDVPKMGTEDYEAGNGLIRGAGNIAYVIDSDARMILEIDLATMEILRSANYAQNLPAQESSLGERVLSWLREQSATTTLAKRWMAMPVISPDGSQLVVDSGMNLNTGRVGSLYVIDLETLQATEEIGDLAGSPTVLTFADNGLLFVFFEKRSLRNDSEGIAIDLESGGQFPFTVPVRSNVRHIFTP
jgi:hypothetical protein